jgi:transcriptional regulator with XRE-family HTH domain
MSGTESSRKASDSTPSLAGLLKEERLARDWSAREFERRADLPTGTLTRLESDRPPKPTLDTLAKIASALNRPMVDLFILGGYVTGPDLPSLGLYLSTKYDGLPRRRIDKIDAEVTALLIEHDFSI